MSVFKYRMQNILNMKTKLEEQAKIEFATANRRVLEEQEKLSMLQNRKKALEKRAKELLKAPSLDVQEIILNRNGILKSQEDIKRQQKVLSKAEEVREEKRNKFMEERTDRKTHEILRENAFEEFMQEEKAAEGKEIDQLTSYTYGQKLTENNE
ncbi:MAG: flagellar export protein FliJ [Lachnospiraceae bacterium]|nr:flagellar export protein FliJ [Lachnospiraceae bacterium]